MTARPETFPNGGLTNRILRTFFEILGRFQADLVVENQVILELKAIRTLLPEHHAQLINYLRATPLEVGLLLNFGKSPEFKRLIYSNKKKKAIFPR